MMDQGFVYPFGFRCVALLYALFVMQQRRQYHFEADVLKALKGRHRIARPVRAG